MTGNTCPNCGVDIIEASNFCPKCGKSVRRSPSSKLWYLIPVFFGIIGGIIAFFILRKRDPVLSKRCLIVGGIMLIAWIFYTILSEMFSSSVLRW